ncbi:hypothetical protein BH23ACT9_BH23ACT9_09620 [soil metagenome]
MSTTSLRHPTGPSTTGRRRAAALTVIAGSLLMCGTTLGGFSPPRNVLVFGLVLVAAWLVDGGADRYLGAGLGAIAVGGGITLGGLWDLSTGATEHVVVYTLIGLGILAASYVNPHNVRTIAFLLIFVGASAANQNFGISYNLGWQLAAILAVWGIVAFMMAGKDTDTSEATVVEDRSEFPVGAGR